MEFTLRDFLSFSSRITNTDKVSAFKFNFFKSGSFVQVTNSTGKVHDISFQAVKAALVDISGSSVCQNYIQHTTDNPKLYKKIEAEEQARFEEFCEDLDSGSLTINTLSRFKYFEKQLRVIAKSFFNDSRAQVIAGEQTKMLFNVISRFVHIANNCPITEGVDLDEEMPFSLIEIERTISYIEGLISFCSVDAGLVASSSSIAVNQIFYGAPGTGKSHTIDALTYGARKTVTVFHPDTLHADFVGALKPMMNSGSITYQFRPGPFTIALIDALTHPNEHTYLIIEEINRAPAAAVFGELFQLLDRKNGASKYPINASDPDMLEYINSVLTSSGCESIQKLFIPSNMSLLATMNSSDQAVMPLDTAFKRRWSFRYIKIDFENESVSAQSFRLVTPEGKVDITWSNFANKVINQTLKELNIPEDRLLGPFFLSEAELSDTESANDALSGKLLVYLWDDVLRHRGRDAVFSKTIRTFSDLHDGFQDGIISIFSESVTQEIVNYAHNVETQAKTASQAPSENA